MSLSVGEVAPDFTLPNQRGEPVSLSSFKGHKPLVVFFYPKDFTPGCTAESCTFRDSYQDFVEAGAEVIGISSDDAASHDRFAQQYGLQYVLLADVGGEVRKRWGVPKTFGLFPGRVTYVLDRDGIVKHVFNSQLNPNRHAIESLQVLKAMKVVQGL